MTDYFSEMGFARRAAISDNELKSRYHELSRLRHPDNGTEPDQAEFERLNSAQRALASPARRVWHLLELEFEPGELEKGGGVDDGLMPLFQRLGETIMRSDALVSRRGSSTTAIGRALLEGEAAEARSELSAARLEIEEQISTYENGLGELDALLLSDREAGKRLGLKVWRNLAFLEKWRGQVREKFAQLF